MSSRFQIFRRLVTGPQASRIPKTTRGPVFWQKPHFSTTVKMSSIGGAGVGIGLHAIVSNPAQVAAQPEEAKDKAHHLKNGKGFTNPWDSYTEFGVFQLMRMFFWYHVPISTSTEQYLSNIGT